MFAYYLLLLSLSSALSITHGNPLVDTPLGLIQGYHKQSYNGRTFSAFEGIPYAKPPIGDLRFEKPVEIEPWFGIWIANTLHQCSQFHFVTYEASGDEDCLYLNVYVPRKVVSSSDNLDVIVHIHSGAFTIGSPGSEGSLHFMDRDVIFINLNYRLSAFGFLSTEDEVVPGNNGLKDQILALRWIQRHIKQFGGNPKSITLTGFSAGGASVHLHYFSKLSRGLFQRGISYSGTAISPWVIQGGALERARQLASAVGCNEESTKEFINCLKQKSAKQILNNVKYVFSPYHSFPLVTFAPVVEKNLDSSFLIDYPYRLLQNRDFNDVPWITSTTSEDGALIMSVVINNIKSLNDQWSAELPYVLGYNHTACDADKIAIASKIKDYYFKNELVSEKTASSIVKMFGDRCFGNDFQRSSQMQTQFSKFPVYSYMYGYTSSFSIIHNKLRGISKLYGVSHGEDVSLVYYNHENKLEQWKLTKSDEFIKNLLLDIVLSYAKTGVPKIKNFDWHSTSSSEEFSYLLIKSPDEIRMSEKNVSSLKFWDSLPLIENDIISKSYCDDRNNEKLNKVEL